MTPATTQANLKALWRLRSALTDLRAAKARGLDPHITTEGRLLLDLELAALDAELDVLGLQIAQRGEGE